MQPRIVISALLIAVFLSGGVPVRGQDTTATHQDLPLVASRQVTTTGAPARDNAPPVQGAQATGLTFTVSKFTDSADGVCNVDCSLCEAINAANQTPGANTIVLNGGVYQLTIPPVLDDQNLPVDDENNAISDLNITDDLTIVGVSAETTTIASAMHQRVLKVQAGVRAQLHQITITGDHSEQDGGGLFNAGGLSLEKVQVMANVSGNYEMGSGRSGGLYNIGTLTLTATTITENTAHGIGGGLFNVGNLTLEQVAVVGNGSGAFSGSGESGGIYNAGYLTIHTSQIVRNSTYGADAGMGSGGGIHNTRVLKVYDSLFQENQASGYEHFGVGGAVSNSGDILIRNSTIISNVATGDGGGLYSDDVGTLVTLQNSTVSDGWCLLEHAGAGDAGECDLLTIH